MIQPSQVFRWLVEDRGRRFSLDDACESGRSIWDEAIWPRRELLQPPHVQLGDPASRADLERVRFIGWPEALMPHSDDLPTWIRKGDIVLIPR
eukprot:SAG31_NODE_20994_length_560_cov_0.817787_2_plen_92_part_01